MAMELLYKFQFLSVFFKYESNPSLCPAHRSNKDVSAYFLISITLVLAFHFDVHEVQVGN